VPHAKTVGEARRPDTEPSACLRPPLVAAKRTRALPRSPRLRCTKRRHPQQRITNGFNL
jgi:hypothetical protein